MKPAVIISAMTHPRRTSACAAAILLAGALFGQSRRAATLDDVTQFVRLAGVDIAPDGKSLVVIASRPNYEDNRFDTELLLVDPSTGRHRSLTHDRRGIKSPRWSPRRGFLAFLAQAPANGSAPAKTQLYVLPMNGGDAQQLTKSSESVDSFAWKPDGSTIAYVTTDPAEKKIGPERHNGAFEAGDDSILTQAAPRPKHIWLVSSAGGEPKRLTQGTWSVSATSELSWSPGGKQLAYVRTPGPHTGDLLNSTVQVLDVETGESRALTGRSKREAAPRFSPAGKWIAYEFPARGPYHTTEILITAPAGGEGRSLTRAIDRNLKLLSWSPDGRAILVGGDDLTSSGVWWQPLEGAAKRLGLDGAFLAPQSPVSIGPNGEIAFIASTNTDPAEVYWKPNIDAPARTLTHLNNGLAGVALGRTERLVWKSDSYELDGVITYPPDFDPSKKYPLVLDIHGGPTGASKEGFSPRPQLLAAQGWVVFEPNYRGSDNLGDAVQSAIVNDAGSGPGRDVMRGIDELNKRGWVDDKRIGVGGWSYGGYMTGWLLGHYPGVWKAAITGAAALDRMDSYNLSDINVGFGDMLGGSPWTGSRLDNYRKQSAIEYVSLIQTPVLILHNTRDERVSITNSYKLYHALRDKGVDVRFIAYPVSGHSAPDPVHQRDVLRRWVEWFRTRL
jgi:dipeptidyl aminopeptidase/acylaminoacyl peptidase